MTFAELEFSECEDCGTVFKSVERLHRNPELYERSYFHGRKSGRDKRFDHRVRKAMRQIRGAMAYGAVRSVLDIGCSLGYVIEAGRRLGLTSAGSDISEYAVAACRAKGLRAEQGTLDRLPFRDGEFDLVVMKHVLEHTPAPKTALAEVRRIMSPTGLVLIAVPDLEYWKGLYRRRSYRYFRPDDLGEQHYVYYRQRSLRRLLTDCGFDVCADSKAFRNPAEGLLGRVSEAFRFPSVAAWQGLARSLRLRRELYFIARACPIQ